MGFQASSLLVCPGCKQDWDERELHCSRCHENMVQGDYMSDSDDFDDFDEQLESFCDSMRHTVEIDSQGGFHVVFEIHLDNL